VRLFLGQLAAVLAIAAVIAVVVAAVRGDPEVRTAAPGSAASPTATSPDASGDSAGQAPASPAPASPAPSSPAPPSPTPSTPAATSTEPSPAPAPPKVDVLNQSAGDGAAAQVARQLRQAGWRIGRVDDFRGNVSTTTVYWLDRPDRQVARELARQLGGVRVQEGFDTLVDGRLSVILVEEPAR